MRSSPRAPRRSGWGARCCAPPRRASPRCRCCPPDSTAGDRLDHPVAERGAALSGGQRHRLALARALLAQPRLLVLHDPTTAVDAVTEHAIARGIRDLRHGPNSQLGTLIITTGPVLLAAADRVVVLRAGAVAADGVHADLAAADPAYRAVVLR
ncbi:ATP-binding cassette domain-containing protein [Micromonosporaceae bacterium Da 78-11]